MLSEGSIDPGWYRYPSFLINLIALFSALFGYASSIPVGHEEFYDIIGPPGLILLGRSIVLLHSLGVVLFAGLLASRLAGSFAAVVAATLVALSPDFVSKDPLSLLLIPFLPARYNQKLWMSS